MEKSVKTIGKIAIISFSLICAYLIGYTQNKTVTETQTIIEVKEVIPDGYIALSECIPLSDVACYFIDGYDYPCFELKDIGNQLDNDDNRSYEDIMKSLPDETGDFQENYIDMRMVIDFEVNEDELQLYFADGTGYYLGG